MGRYSRPFFVQDVQVVARDAQHRAGFQARELAHAVFRVNQEVAHRQSQRVGHGPPAQLPAPQGTAALEAVDQVLGQHHRLVRLYGKAALAARFQEAQRPRLQARKREPGHLHIFTL